MPLTQTIPRPSGDWAASPLPVEAHGALELNPAHVAEQRRVAGWRRIKTDAIDLEPITELVLAGRGRLITDREVVIGELAAWAAHRSRRVVTRTATKNQLLGQLDRAFPGLTLALPDVVGTKIGRLVAAEFADPARLSALGVSRLIRFAGARNVQLRRPVAERLVTAAADALPTRDGVVARRVLATDLGLLADLDTQIENAESELAAVLPVSPYATLTSVPGWGVVRVSNHAAALGDPGKWPGPRCTGRRDSHRCNTNRPVNAATERSAARAASRSAAPSSTSVSACGCPNPTAKAYAAKLKSRGKPGGIIASALAHRATRIAHALLRDHASYDPSRWGLNSSWAFLGPGPRRRRHRSCPPAAPAAQPGRTTWTATTAHPAADEETHPRRLPFTGRGSDQLRQHGGIGRGDQLMPCARRGIAGGRAPADRNIGTDA